MNPIPFTEHKPILKDSQIRRNRAAYQDGLRVSQSTAITVVLALAMLACVGMAIYHAVTK